MTHSVSGNDFRKMMLKRTQQLAIGVTELVNEFPSKAAHSEYGNQLIKSATYVAENYKASLQTKSNKDIYPKLCKVVEECDETEFWLDFLYDSKLVTKERVEPLRTEAEELLKLLSKSKINSKAQLGFR